MFKQMLTKTLVRCVIGIIGIFQYASAQVPDTFTRITEGDVVNDTSDSYGVAWGDYDNDGDLDLYVATYMGPNRLYRNDGNEIFSEVAVQLGVNGGNGWSLGVSWADYDNDGDLDLFVGEAQNKLFRNDGNSFSDVGISSGFTHLNATYSAVWADYDNDGDLDLFTANWYGVNLLYQNDQNYFTDVAPSVGIVETGYSRAAAWGDYDNDGDLDLYVCRGASWENQPDLLYRNDNAYFTNVADSVGITDVLYSEGVDWGDYDNDGDLDLFVTTSNLQPNKLYRNDDGIFTDVSADKGVDNSEGSSHSVAWIDYDNDGDLDLFVTRWEGCTNLLYENEDGTFTEIQNQVGLGDDTGRSIGLSWGDFNNDGFIDVYIPNRFGVDFLYRNNGNSNHWIIIQTIGTVSNANGVGTRIEVVSGDLRQIREINGGSGQSSQNSLAAEFGLGDTTIIDSIKVKWPSGIIQILTNVAVNQFLTITEIEQSNISVSVELVNAFPGDTISLPVNVIFPEDSTFSSAEISFGGYFGLLDFIEIDTITSLIGSAGWTYQINETDSLLFTAFAGADDISGQGVLFWLKFAVPETASGFIPVTLESAIFNTGDIPVLLNSGGVNIPDYGDVDLNGFVQAYDASLILKYLVDYINLNEVQLFYANVSLDTTVSALDASLILQYVVGLIDSLPYDTTWGSLLASGNIVMEDGEIQAGQSVEVPLYLSNGSNILSFEGLFTFNPEHLVFDDLTWSELLDGFTIETNAETGEIKVAGAGSLSDGQEGVFATLQFTVNENFNDNETTVILQRLRWNEEPVMEDVATATLGVLGINDNLADIPTEFALYQNYPNPFNPITTIKYGLPKGSKVTLKVFDILGREVATLVNEHQAAGYQQVSWDATGHSSGIYFYQIQAGDFQKIRKMILLK